MKNKQHKIQEETVRGNIDYEHSHITSKKINFLISGRKTKSKPIEGKRQLDINIAFKCPCCKKGLLISLRKDLT